VDITADRGTYNSKAELVVLRDNVLCLASDGTEIRLSEVSLDVRKGHVISQKPVEVVQPSGHISANQLEVLESGAVVQFRGGVRYRSSAPENPATAEAAPPGAAR
jgi:lipopolysaccharide export system protein LptC